MTARLERGHCADYEPSPTTAWRGRRMARRVVAVHTSCAQFFLPAGGLFSRLTAECCQYLVPLSSGGQGGANDFQHAATHRHPCYLTSLPQPTRLFFPIKLTPHLFPRAAFCSPMVSTAVSAAGVRRGQDAGARAAAVCKYCSFGFRAGRHREARQRHRTIIA